MKRKSKEKQMTAAQARRQVLAAFRRWNRASEAERIAYQALDRVKNAAAAVLAPFAVGDVVRNPARNYAFGKRVQVTTVRVLTRGGALTWSATALVVRRDGQPAAGMRYVRFTETEWQANLQGAACAR